MNVALILSGGTGNRLGSEIPKQYLSVGGRSVISYCLETIIKSSYIDAVWIVAQESRQVQIEECLESYDIEQKAKMKGFSRPGKNRQLSILNGLEDISKYASPSDFVMIHDAARPLLTETTIEQIFEALKNHDGVIPMLPMKDTIYLSEDGKRVSSLLNRNHVFAGQAPEAFVFGKYLEANRVLMPDAIYDINGSTEPAILYGMDVLMIPGDEGNFKITTQEDLKHFEELIEKRKKDK